MSYCAADLCAVLDAHAPAGATGLVVAVSGGADSASLLAAAAALGTTFRGLGVRAAHIDHGLQGAAASFREACAALCASLHIPLTVIAVSIPTPPGVSIEAEAREARYAALALELKAGECLLTAHHREDQAETLLLQALRGAGLKGMSAMPVCRPLGRGWHLRPVLKVAQGDLLAFGASAPGAAMHGAFVADPMNQDLSLDRAFLRRQVWPVITSRWPGAARALSRAARHAAAAQMVLDGAAAVDVGRLRDGAALSVPGLRVLGKQDRINALRFWLCEAGVAPPSTARMTEALRQIFEAKDDQSPSIAWGSVALRRYRQRIFLTEARPPCLEGTRRWYARSASAVELGPGLGELRWVAQSGGIDARRLPEILIVRARIGGETLKPASNAKTQSLKHLCQSQGVLPWMRAALPCLFADDVLIAVGDLWMDARWCAAAGDAGFALDWRQAPVIV